MTWQQNRPVKPWFDMLLMVLSATLLVLIFPGFDIYALAWIALVPLLLLIKHSGPGWTFLSSLAAGFMFFSALLWWVLRLDGFNPFNFSLAILGNAGYLGMFGLLAHYFQKKVPRWNALTFPATWVLLEYIRSHMGFLSFPWGILGYSQHAVLPVAGVSAYTGVYGVSFLIVAVNTVLAEIIHPYLFYSKTKLVRGIPSWGGHRTSLGILAAVLILFSSSFLHGLFSSKENGSPSKIKAALVQGNVYWSRYDEAGYRKSAFEKYNRLSMSAADSGPDLIVWPSSSVPGKLPYNPMLVKILADLSEKTDAFLLVGSTGYDKFNPEQRKTKGLSNSAFLVAPTGKIVGRYDKIMLLPFDEYLPLRGHVKWPSWLASSDMTDAHPGKDLTVFSINKFKFGVLICWESLFPDLYRKMTAKRVDFMVSMTNEGFTDIPAAHYQMWAMNVFRAIENNVSIIRTASTGVSGIIEPTGRIAARVKDHNAKDVNVEGYVVGKIPLVTERTFYNRYGDWFIFGLLAIFMGFMTLALFGKAHPSRNESA